MAETLKLVQEFAETLGLPALYFLMIFYLYFVMRKESVRREGELIAMIRQIADDYKSAVNKNTEVLTSLNEYLRARLH